MSISSDSTRKAGPFTGTGAIVPLPFSFKVFTAADVLVIRTDLSGIESTLALGTDYSVSLNTNQDSNPGGTVTPLIAPGVGYLTTLSSQVAAIQSVILTNTGGFFPTVLNDAMDRLTILVQQLKEQMSRAVTTSISSGISPTVMAGYIVALYNNLANIISVAGNAININAVNANSTNINTVAADHTPINVIGSNSAQVVALGNDLTGLPVAVDYGDLSPATNPAGASGVIATVYNDLTNINTVASDKANIDAVAGDLININTVASDKANIDLVVTNIGAINTNATNIVVIQNANANAAAAAASAAAAAISASSAAASAATGALVFAGEASVASAATTDIGAATSMNVLISGTTTITSFGSTAAAGVHRDVRMAAGLTLTYNATSLILPGAANIVTAAGDCFEAECLGSGNWVVRSYQRASGAPLALANASVTAAALAATLDLGTVP